MSGNDSSPTVINWAPQPGPQTALINCPIEHVFFGGTRGGGKTDGMLGKWALKEARYGTSFNALMCRRTTVSAEDAIERSKDIFGPIGGKFNEARLRWRMPNGGRVSFGYLDNLRDADHHQGKNVTDVWIEEVGQYPDPAPIDRMNGVLRSAQGIPTQLALTGNPGGAGQHWIANRYQLIPFLKQPYMIEYETASGEKCTAAVIPSRITDNKILLESDPGYVDRLRMVGGPELVRAWLEGDWNAIEGAYFECWHEWVKLGGIIQPFKLAEHWLRFRSHDWGSARPASTGWWAVPSESIKVHDTIIPKGAMVRYREWYAASGPNQGLKMDATELALQILKLTGAADEKRIAYTVADPSIFAHDGGPSIAERMMKAGLKNLRRGDNRRAGTRGQLGGWDQMRERFIGEDGRPMMYFFDTCKDSIRTVPVLQHDENRIEDVDTDSEDHAADEIRYGCMSRPYMRPKPTKKRPIEDQPTFDERFKRHQRNKERLDEALI